jgi:transcriptional adapter 3
VDEDFSKWKQPGNNQVNVQTFYSYIEPWLRPIKEEDVGFLAHAGDEDTPFIVPPLGAHYTEVWEAEDVALYGHPLPGMSLDGPPQRKRALDTWEPSTLNDGNLLDEQCAQGPITERLLSALLPTPDVAWKGVKAAEEAMEGRPSGGAGAAAARDSMTVADLEDRVRAQIRYLGVVDEQVRCD